MSRPNYDLAAAFQARQNEYANAHAKMNELADVVDAGKAPRSMNNQEGVPVKNINMLRMAAIDLATMAGKVFNVEVQPLSNKTTDKERAERIEDICYCYNDAGQVDMLTLMQIWAKSLILFGDAVGIVLPDYDHKTPYFHHRDSRTHFPPVGWAPWSQAPLNDTLFHSSKTLAQLKLEYPDKRAALERAYETPILDGYRRAQEIDPMKVILDVGEFYSNDYWALQILDDKHITLVESDSSDRNHPGVCPVFTMSSLSTTANKGRSDLADQLDLQAALSEMLSLKLAFFKRIIYAPIIGPKLDGDGNLRYGPDSYNTIDPELQNPTGVTQLFPQGTVDAERMIAMVMGFTRQLSRDPESFQGAGEANSGKALSELKSGPEATVTDWYWPRMKSGLRRAYELAAKMDVKLWGNERKRVTGSKLNTPFTLAYTPNQDLRGQEGRIRVDPGLGLGGYQGMIANLQRLGAGVMSIDDFLEADPQIRDARATKRRIETDNIAKVAWAAAQAQAQQGVITLGALAELKEMVENGSDLFDAMAELDRQGKWTPPPQPPQLPGLSDLQQGPMPIAPGLKAGGLPSLAGLRQ